MKLIVAGTRTVRDPRVVERAIAEALASWGLPLSAVEEIVSGGARGVDRLGEQFAARRGVRVRVFEADWQGRGIAAGPLRNAKMAEHADALVAVWDGASRGTADMIAKARARGLRVHVHPIAATAPPP